MKRQRRQVYLAVGILLAMVVGFLLFSWADGGEGSPEVQTSSDTQAVIWTLQPEEVQEIEVVRPHESYHLLPAGETWTVEGWNDLPRNEQAYDVVSHFFQLSGWEVGLAKDAGLADFGLEPPAATVIVRQKDGSENKILIGIGTSRGYYVLPQGGDTVFVVEGDRVASFTEPRQVFISREVAPFSADPSQIELEKITYHTQEGGDFTVGPTPIDNTTAFSSGFSLLEPIQREVAYGKVENITGSAKILSGEVEAVHPSEEVLAGFGLAPPQGKMTVYYTEASDSTEQGEIHAYTVLLGEVMEDGRRAVMREGAPVVYGVGDKAVPWKAYTPENLMSLQLFRSPMEEVASIQLASARVDAVFTLTGDSKEAVMGTTQTGTPIDKTSLDLFYELLARGEGLHWSDEPGQTILLTCTVTYRDGKAPLVLTFYEKNQYEVIVHSSDPTLAREVVLARSYLDRLEDCAILLENGKEITTILW